MRVKFWMDNKLYVIIINLEKVEDMVKNGNRG